jgi:hypothetical protein
MRIPDAALWRISQAANAPVYGVVEQFTRVHPYFPGVVPQYIFGPSSPYISELCPTVQCLYNACVDINMLGRKDQHV